jgi:hypothetical protein
MARADRTITVPMLAACSALTGTVYQHLLNLELALGHHAEDREIRSLRRKLALSIPILLTALSDLHGRVTS